MRALIALLCAAVAFAQLPAPGGNGGGGIGGSGAPLYEATFSAVTTVTVTAATHGLGTKPVSLGCFDNGTPKLAITLTANYPQVAANGDITWAWTGSKTGACYATSSGASGTAGGVLSGTYPNPAFGSPLNLAALAMILPERAFGSLPAAGSSNGHVYVVTDAASAGSCSAGGGSSRALCRSNGSAWEAIGGGAGGGEPVITPGLNTQYWRGDKTWQDLNKAAVGLSNVANVDTTNASNIASGTLNGARLPNPAVGTKGGVEAKTCNPTTEKVSAIGTDGIPVCSTDQNSGGPGSAHTIKVNGSSFTQRAGLNFLSGAGCTITGGDDAGNDETEITVSCPPDPAIWATYQNLVAGTHRIATATNSGNAYTACPANANSAWRTAGTIVSIIVAAANTGAATLAYCGAAAAPIVTYGNSALSGSELTASPQVHHLTWDGTSFRMPSTGGGSGAPTGAQYLTLATDGGLSGERVLVAGPGITVNDGGANGNLTISALGIPCRSTTGNDTYTCTPSPALASYARGLVLYLDADTANTGTATVNANGLGAISILKRDGNALSDGDITANRGVLLYYNGTNFNIIGDGGGGAAPRVVYQPLTAFDDSAWSDNGATAMTRDTSVSGKVRYTTNAAVANLAARLKSVAAGDFSFTVGMIPWIGPYGNSGSFIGIVFADSGGTQKLLSCGFAVNAGNTGLFTVNRWAAFNNDQGADPTAISAPFDSFGYHNYGRPIYFRGSRTGTNIKCEISQDGEYFEELWAGTEAYFTVTNIGVGAIRGSSTAVRFTVFGGIIP